MPDAENIARGVYLVGGPQISHAEDAASYVIDFGVEAVMIDCGVGRSLPAILENIETAGIDPAVISTLILIHCHIDHVGAAPELRRRLGLKAIIHDLDAEAVEKGDSIRTAADWYDADFFIPTMASNATYGTACDRTHERKKSDTHGRGNRQ